jgi:hypothetical protein
MSEFRRHVGVSEFPGMERLKVLTLTLAPAPKVVGPSLAGRAFDRCGCLKAL